MSNAKTEMTFRDHFPRAHYHDDGRFNAGVTIFDVFLFLCVWTFSLGGFLVCFGAILSMVLGVLGMVFGK
jgi:hypothetical protein